MSELIANSILAGSEAIKTYKRDGLNLGVETVKELIVIEINGITANATKIIRLSDTGKTLQLLSAYVDGDMASGNKNIKVDVTYFNNILFTINLNKDNMPYKFPSNVITSTLDLAVTPTFSINKMLIYCEEIVLLERLIF